MSLHLEKVLAHAEKQLVLEGKKRPADILALYKKFLKIEDHRLRLEHQAGGGGRQVCQRRVELLDIILRHLHQGAASFCIKEKGLESTPLTIVAIGGYGRGELNPGSDVDIMFLHNGSSTKPTPYTSEMVEQILYMLWDVGFKVGHSVRSLKGVIKQANEDMLSKTSLLESRIIIGDRTLFQEFREAFQKHCVQGKQKEYILWRIEDQKTRHGKHGNTVFLQEPNIKSGCGGLRDYQNLLWVAYFMEGAGTTSKMLEKKMLHETEKRALDRAYDFLLRVRTDLHYLNKRPTDILTLQYQGQIANRFNYPQKGIIRRSEAFMRDYFAHARNIHLITQSIFSRLSLPHTKDKRALPSLSFLANRPKKIEEFDGFYSQGGLIFYQTREVFSQDPMRLMRVFQHAQLRELSLSPELEQLIRRRIRLVNKTFQYSRTTRQTFEAILSRKGQVGRILRMMHEVNFLGAYMPEFGKLTCLVQHEFFHRYTADEHTIVCIEKLDKVIDTDDSKLKNYRLLFQKLEDPFVLYLSLLLHDTGKAANVRVHAEASAILAQKVSRRLQLSPDRRKSLILLVDHHVTLSETAQRRNLDDLATITGFADIIKSRQNLESLMLLTLADGMGTSDESWSDWKETLVWYLFNATNRFLEDGGGFMMHNRSERQSVMDLVKKKLGKDYSGEIEAHFDYMPQRYFSTFEGEDIVTHIRLFRAFFEAQLSGETPGLSPVVRWIDHPEQGHTELLVCTWDRSELLARIAGALSLASLNILSADIFTRGDNLVLDVFRVCDTNFSAVTDERDRVQVEKNIVSAMESVEFEFRPLLETAKKNRRFLQAPVGDFPTRILVTNHANPNYTLVEVQTPDRLGLLYDLLRAFGKARINIALSRITTEKGAAIDSFYVTDLEGKKVTNQNTISTLQRQLTKAAVGVVPGGVALS